jgi:hypothetical protein
MCFNTLLKKAAVNEQQVLKQLGPAHSEALKTILQKLVIKA